MVATAKKIKPKGKSTIMRQWEMLRLLTVSRWDDKNLGRWDKASEITAKLNDLGYDIQVRSVQRDLLELSTVFPIELNDSNPRDYGWRWYKGQNLNIQGMGSPEALAMCLVEKQLQQQFPVAMLESLQGIFNLARKSLDDLEKQNNNRAKGWISKVRVVPTSQALMPPLLEHEIQSKIYSALLDNVQVLVKYKSAENFKEKEYELHPLGLIMRGPVSYLVATARDYEEPRLYALHRFIQATVLDKKSKVPKNFNLDSAIEAGLADFALQDGLIQLELRCSEVVEFYLRETKLSKDQKITAVEGEWSRLTATVNDTRQLRWWLLGQGSGLKVCAPKRLRDEIKSELKLSSKLYE